MGNKHVFLILLFLSVVAQATMGPRRLIKEPSWAAKIVASRQKKRANPLRQILKGIDPFRENDQPQKRYWRW